MRRIPAAPGTSPLLARGAGASGSLQASPQASHHFCSAPWVGMGCGGRQEGAPDLTRGVRLATEESQAMPGLAGAVVGAQPGGY